MTRTLPNVPIAVVAAAEETLIEGMRISGNHGVKSSAWDEHRRHAHEERDEKKTELIALAETLFDWCEHVRAKLQIRDLHRMFGRGEKPGPHVSIINHQTTLEAKPRAPEGLLRSELELSLHPDRIWLVRHHEWFDGYRVGGGGTLASPIAVYTSLHPQMLREIHEQVAEGAAWGRIITGFKKLIEDFKDR